MSLNSEITELRTLWRKSPWWVKLSLLFSVFLSASSIASISETVVKWKGFILAGVEFYRASIRGPILSILRNWTPFHIQPGFADYLVLMTLVFAAVLRGYSLEFRIERSRSSRVGTIALLVWCTACVGFAMYKASVAGPTARVSILPAVGFYLAAIGLALWPPRRQWDMLIVIYMVVPPLLVCMIAAVNLGLK